MNAITLGSAIYPAADPGRLSASHSRVRDVKQSVAPLQANFLKERVALLEDLMSRAHQTYWKNSVKTRWAFDALDFTGVNATLEEVRNKQGWTAEQKQAKSQVLIGDLQCAVADALKRLSADVDVLAEVTRSIDAQTKPDLQEELALVASDLQFDEARLLKIRGQLTDQNSAVTDITEALALFKKYGLEDVFKMLLPSEDDIDLALNAVKKQELSGLAKGAVKKIESHLQVVGEMRRFTELAKARDQLRTEAAELAKEISRLQANITQLQALTGYYDLLPSAWDHAQVWSAEIGNIVNAYRAFAALDIHQASADPGKFANVSQLCKRLSSYIADVQYSH